ncbi:MAG: hypothetical protein ACI9RU_002183 [Litorivivens sp.]|jgi:hypothetical protein
MCSQHVSHENNPAQEVLPSAEFNELWYDGNAEISVYELEQARYGEIHPGQASMIFVTEPFSADKQVKLDNPQATPDDKVDVLKLNFTRKFNTGIYPYSLMTSVFSPVKQTMGVLKVSTSSQEWCGHSYVQVNKTNSGFGVDQKSYFESEGDMDFQLPECYLEDNVWTQIRINPEHLPIGEIRMVPGTQSIRFRHITTQPLAANASLNQDGLNSVYSVKYSDRELSIVFETSFPHAILTWQETYISGWGANAKELSTAAKLISRERLPYWNLLHVADSTYRQMLQLK